MADQARRGGTEPGTFSEREYATDPGRVLAHAVATGAAVVERDGRPHVIITVPTTDLPTLE